MSKSRKPKVVATPTAHIYARRSHIEENDSIKDQLMRCNEFIKYKLKLPEVREWKDVAVSAFRNDFLHRPESLKLMASLRKGDHVVVDKLDRLIRNVLDFLTIMDIFEDKEVTLHIRNFGGMEIDMSSSMGKFFMTMWAAIAELESGIKSERVRDVFRAKRERGELTNTVPIGMTTSTHTTGFGKSRKISRFLVWCPIRRGAMRDIHRLHDQCGLGFYAIAKVMNEEWCARTGVPFEKLKPFDCATLQKLREKKQKPKGITPPWTAIQVTAHYYRERFYRDLEEEGITSARDVAIAINERLETDHHKGCVKRKLNNRSSSHLLPTSILEPVKNPEEALPNWAKRNEKLIQRVNSPKGEHHRQQVYAALNTLDAYLEKRDSEE